MRVIVFMAVIIGCVSLTPLFAEAPTPEIKLRELELDGLMVQNGTLTLTLTFDVRKDDVFDEVTFDFYLLMNPQDKDFDPQFTHCRTVHRYLEKQTSARSGVGLETAAMDAINPRNNCKYAVVATFRGEEIGVENSEDDRWWESPALGEPVENVLKRFANVPIVRAWESE
jgi:hypothetical protein